MHKLNAFQKMLCRTQDSWNVNKCHFEIGQIDSENANVHGES